MIAVLYILARIRPQHNHQDHNRKTRDSVLTHDAAKSREANESFTNRLSTTERMTALNLPSDPGLP